MKLRQAVLPSGQRFEVPERIQRLDSKSTHGWQVRYGRAPTAFFADGSSDGSGAAESLAAAVAELQSRIRKLPAPTGLKTETLKWKKSNLPLGISGPLEVRRKGKTTPYYVFQISVPLPQGGSTTRSTYIGTANTISDERIADALMKAIAIREDAVGKVQREANRAKRAAAAQVLT